MRKKLNIIAFILNSMAIVTILIIMIRSTLPAAAIGIIGGADGPTAIFYTTSFPPGVLYAVIALIIILYEIVFIKNIRTKK